MRPAPTSTPSARRCAPALLLLAALAHAGPATAGAIVVGRGVDCTERKRR